MAAASPVYRPALRVAPLRYWEVRTSPEHDCDFPEEHRATGEPILFACQTCGLPASAQMKRQQIELDALRDQLHAIKRKKAE